MVVGVLFLLFRVGGGGVWWVVVVVGCFCDFLFFGGVGLCFGVLWCFCFFGFWFVFVISLG